jgi:hypothetical protein
MPVPVGLLAMYAKCMQKSDDGVDSRALYGLNGS